MELSKLYIDENGKLRFNNGMYVEGFALIHDIIVGLGKI
jgi:hypothetical protein